MSTTTLKFLYGIAVFLQVTPLPEVGVYLEKFGITGLLLAITYLLWKQYDKTVEDLKTSYERRINELIHTYESRIEEYSERITSLMHDVDGLKDQLRHNAENRQISRRNS